MANNYTTIPAIIPGDLTIAGKLYVQGDEFRMGAATPYLRLLRVAPDNCGWSVNLQKDLATRDDLTKAGYYTFANISHQHHAIATYDRAGNSYQATARRVFWISNLPYHFVGNAGLQTVASRTIFGNQMGANGDILVRLCGSVGCSATGTIALAATWAGNIKTIITFGVSTNASFWAELYIANGATTANQFVSSWCAVGNGASCSPALNVSVDTTVNQTLAVTINPSDTTSVIDIRSFEAEWVSRDLAL